MFLKFNTKTKKQLSIIIIFVIFASCVSIISYDIDKDLKPFEVSENLMNANIADISYEMLALQYSIVQSRYKDRNLKTNFNDKAAMLIAFFAANNIDKSINKSNLRNISEIYSMHDTILMFIHDKDGKKQLM